MEQLILFLEQLKLFSTQEDLISIGREINQVKIDFEDTLLEAERLQQIALLDSKEKGELLEEVDYREIKNTFLSLYKTVQEQRKHQISLKDTLERENLKLKKGLLEELKQIIESEENIGTAFQSYKNIHETWKKIGEIPRDQRDTIQKEYSRLLEIFFYTMRIYRELKDHDYKRNLQLKQKVLHKLQQLRNEDKDIKSVELQLRVLQDEWEEIGPVLNDDWELLKSKYWETVRQIYDKINAHYESQRQVYVQNMEQKRALVSAIESLCLEAQNATHNKTWDLLIERLRKVQEDYKKIGPGSRRENEMVWKAFRAQCDAFFELKKQYNKSQNEVYSGFYHEKKALIEAANQLKDSSDWKEASHQIINLQKKWKTIGSSGKAENRLWMEFRGVCDAFFHAKETANQSLEKEKEENLIRKMNVVSQISDLPIADKAEALKTLRELSAAFLELGPVPHQKKDEVYTKYKTALDAKYSDLAVDAKEKAAWAYTAKIESMQASPDRLKLLQKERYDLRKQMERLEQEMNRMETNLSFFARSKGADVLRAEVEKKISDMKAQVNQLRSRLKQLPHE